MASTSPGDGQIIQVTTPAAQPTFIVDDSKAKATLITIFSLIVGGITLFSSLLTVMKDRDLEAFKALLTSDGTVAWFAAASPFLWIGYRAIRSFFKKKTDVAIAAAAPNALLKSELAPLPATVSPLEPAPLTRAGEATTRLVDASSALAADQAANYEADRASVMELTNGIVGDKVPERVAHLLAPPAAGIVAEGEDMLQERQTFANDPEFDAAYKAWSAIGDGSAFATYLRENGWEYVANRWVLTGATS